MHFVELVRWLYFMQTIDALHCHEIHSSFESRLLLDPSYNSTTVNDKLATSVYGTGT